MLDLPTQFLVRHATSLKQGDTELSNQPTRTEQHKQRVLFIPASIRSHIIPTLYLANLLADEYDIFYAVTNPLLASIVVDNGFTPVLNTTVRVAIGMERQYLALQQKGGFWSSLYAVYSNALYWQRKQELDELLAQVKPTVVIVDIFSSTDFLVLYHHRATVRLLFCNPMLSTYRVGSLPTVSETNWTSTPSIDNQDTRFNWRSALRSPGAALYQAAMRHQVTKLTQLAGLSTEHQLIDTPYTRLFTNVPELILAPAEFELAPEVRKPHQHYLGLGIKEVRTDSELDAEFARQWPELSKRQRTGQRIIYCSFGTYYTGSNKALLDFVTNLLEAISTVPNVQLVCSVNNLVVETLRVQHAAVPNVHFFRRVPQLVVLKQATVHITHGGLGSVKESILYNVPMLVYPLDAQYDQPGNGLKVEHHGLGLRGHFSWERAHNLRAKLLLLLEDVTFRDNVARFRQTCLEQYTDEKVMTTLRELLTVATL